MISVFIEEKKLEKNIRFQEGITVKQVLKFCNINPVEVLCVINNSLVLEGHKLKKQDKLELLSVISGG